MGKSLKWYILKMIDDVSLIYCYVKGGYFLIKRLLTTLSMGNHSLSFLVLVQILYH